MERDELLDGPTVVRAIELGTVAALLENLSIDEVGPMPGAQLSLDEQLRRHWTVATSTSRTTYVGGGGAAGYVRPVWVPLRALLWGAELARSGDALGLRVQDLDGVPAFALGAPHGSALFDLPVRPAVEVVDTTRVADATSSAVVERSDLIAVLRAASRTTDHPVMVRDRAFFTVGIATEGLSVSVDWSTHGTGRSTYRIRAEVAGSANPAERTCIEVMSLLAVAHAMDGPLIELSIRADGSVLAHDQSYMWATFAPLRRPEPRPLSLEAALAPLHPVMTPAGYLVRRGGTSLVISAPIGRPDLWRITTELARDVEPHADVLTEVNQLNLGLGFGRVALDGDVLVAVTEVRGDQLATIADTVVGLAGEAGQIGPLVASLVASADPA